MMKRKVLIFGLVLAALLALFGCANAQTDPIVCVMELDPNKLTGPGTINVTITVSNSGSTDMKDPVTLYDPAAQIVTDFGTNGSATLKAGESVTWTGTYDVNQRTLDNGTVVYFVKYTIYKDSGEAVGMSQSIRQKISLQTAEADIDVNRTISPSIAREGQEVVVKYHIRNAGTVDLLDITIQENKDIHKEKQTIPKLQPGQTAEIGYTVTMGKKDLTSGATITYKGPDDAQSKTYTVEDQTIVYGESSLTAKLTSSSKGVAINGKLTLTLELKNTGSVDYSDIRVSDAALGDVFSNQKLEAGKSLTLEKEVTLPATMDYQFTITAIDSTGTETVTMTDSVTVTAVDPADALNLAVTVTPDRTEVFEQPGRVRFTVEVTNDSKVEAKQVKIAHGDTAIYTFASIAPGQTRRISRDTALSMAGKYRFTVTAQDPLENTLSFDSNEVQIAFSVPTPPPATPTPAPDPTPEPTFNPATIPPITHDSIGTVPKLVQKVLLPVLIAAGVVLLAGLGLLVVATKRRADQKKAAEAAIDQLERAKRRDYATRAEEQPAQPVRSEPAPAPIGNAAPMDLMDDEEPAQELPHLKYARNASAMQPAQPAQDESLLFDDMQNDYTEPEQESPIFGSYDGYNDPYSAYSADEELDADEPMDDREPAPQDDGMFRRPTGRRSRSSRDAQG